MQTGGHRSRRERREDVVFPPASVFVSVVVKVEFLSETKVVVLVDVMVSRAAEVSVLVLVTKPVATFASGELVASTPPTCSSTVGKKSRKILELE
jgi:hypothetical protein